MSVERATRLRNGKIVDPTFETPTTTSLMVAEANSVDTDPSENNDVSSRIAEIRENYEENQRSAVKSRRREHASPGADCGSHQWWVNLNNSKHDNDERIASFLYCVFGSVIDQTFPRRFCNYFVGSLSKVRNIFSRAWNTCSDLKCAGASLRSSKMSGRLHKWKVLLLIIIIDHFWVQTSVQMSVG